MITPKPKSVKETPLLFQGDMVRALLNDIKTQTRRVAKPQHFKASHEIPDCVAFDKDALAYCPLGQVGDKIWVKETFTTYRAKTPDEERKTKAILKRFEEGKVKDIVAEALKIPASTGELKYLYAADFGDWAYDKDSDLGPWKPSIFMPRTASRITLEIVEVRVQRVREISEEDAKAEGVVAVINKKVHGWTPHVLEYSLLWDSINAKRGYPWIANPWVWAITFKRL